MTRCITCIVVTSFLVSSLIYVNITWTFIRPCCDSRWLFYKNPYKNWQSISTRFGLFFSLNSAPLNYSEQSELRPWRERRTMLFLLRLVLLFVRTRVRVSRAIASSFAILSNLSNSPSSSLILFLIFIIS